jgi:hypothetical protein
MFSDEQQADDSEEAPSSSQALVQQYAAAIKRQRSIPFITPFPSLLTPARQWVLGAAILVAFYAVEGWFLVSAMRVKAPKAGASLIAVEGASACARTQNAILGGLASYKKVYGSWPRTLDLLGVPHFHGSPVDPVSGRRYELTTRGDAVVVACPNPWLHEFPSTERH